MSTFDNTIPGYKINEYILVLNPHEELRYKIHKVQDQFAKDYESTTALNIKPNIPLVKFFQYEMMESKFLQKINSLALTFKPIKVELKDYSSFPSHTIFIHVSNSSMITKMVKEIRKDSGRLFKLNEDNKPHFFNEPFIPIGIKLLPWQYEKAWNEYSHRHFTGRFIADSMLLLKRPVGDKRYQILSRIEFQNLLIPQTQQGDLFAS
ncbi:MAG: 2'-5' RNA ligase family protein [Bacteroidota bacterium]